MWLSQRGFKVRGSSITISKVSYNSETSLFQPHLGPEEVAGLVRLLDLLHGRVISYVRLAQVDKAIGCFSEVAAFQRLGLVRFHCMTFYWTVNYVHSIYMPVFMLT